MNRGRDIGHTTKIKMIALMLLTVMMTLLVGQSVHTYIHSTHCCEHSHDGEEKHDDCKICNFELPLFDSVDAIVITFVVSLITTIYIGYKQNNLCTEISVRSSRAPPYSIL